MTCPVSVPHGRHGTCPGFRNLTLDSRDSTEELARTIVRVIQDRDRLTALTGRLYSLLRP
jgi:hypothetical protein